MFTRHAGETFHDSHSDFGFKFARGEVIHEEQWCGALRCDVVHAVIDEIATRDRARWIFISNAATFEFSAEHTIDARDENGIEVFLVYRKQAAEPADLAGARRA